MQNPILPTYSPCSPEVHENPLGRFAPLKTARRQLRPCLPAGRFAPPRETSLHRTLAPNRETFRETLSCITKMKTRQGIFIVLLFTGYVAISKGLLSIWPLKEINVPKVCVLILLGVVLVAAGFWIKRRG